MRKILISNVLIHGRKSGLDIRYALHQYGNIENFWPAEIGTQKMMVPKTILVEQANFFNERMKNQLVAKVISRHTRSNEMGDQIMHEFDITVPSLGNYSFTLFKAIHDISIYPVSIYFELEDAAILDLDEGQLGEALKNVFSSKKTITTINGLLAQV